MSCNNPKRFLNMNKTIQIKIKNFTNSKVCEKIITRLKLANLPAEEYCIVEIYPKGISPKYQGYVSAEVSKIPSLEKSIKWYENFSLYILMSVIDVNGDGRCRQSYAQENMELPFGIPDLLDRSFLESLADEFLPEDTLTIQCELVGIYYSEIVDIDEEYDSIDALKDSIEEISDSTCDISINYSLKPFSCEMFKTALSVIGLLNCFLMIRFDASFTQRIKDIIPLYDDRDEIRKTYFGSLEIFRKYLALKEKLNNIINHYGSTIIQKFTYFLNEEVIHIQMQTTSQRRSQWMSENRRKRAFAKTEVFWKFLMNPEVNPDAFDEYDAINKFYKILKLVMNCYEKAKERLLKELITETKLDKSGRKNHISKKEGSETFLNNRDEEESTERNQFYDSENTLKFLENVKEMLQYSLDCFFYFCKMNEENKMVSEIEAFFKVPKQHQSSQSHHELDLSEKLSKWNFNIETNDGVLFSIPFEDNKVTLGSKLISSSKFFERMLENPMREKHEKRVKLKGTECDAFINFLHFLQSKEIKVETFAKLCNSCMFADYYYIPEMMSLLSLININEIEMLAHLHADNHLPQLVETFYQENIQQVSEQNDHQDIYLPEKSTTVITDTKNKEHDFEFYR